MEHEEYLRRAIGLAVENVRSSRGGPFGSVIVFDGAVIAEGTNLVTRTNDPTAHAEIVAIREACRKLGRFHLKGCTIYSSCEPCPMCLSALYWARVDGLCFASTRDDAAAAGFDDSFLYEEIPLPLDRRKIPTHSLLRDEGASAFAAWSNTPSRIPY